MQKPSEVGNSGQQPLSPINNNDHKKIPPIVLQVFSLLALTFGLGLIFFNPGTLSLLGIIGSLDVIVVSLCIGGSFLFTVISFLMFFVVTMNINRDPKKRVSSSSNSSEVESPKIDPKNKVKVFGIENNSMNCGFCALLQVIFNDSDIMEKVKECFREVKYENKGKKFIEKEKKNKKIYEWLLKNFEKYKSGESVNAQEFRELIAEANNYRSISCNSGQQIPVYLVALQISQIFLPARLHEIRFNDVNLSGQNEVSNTLKTLYKYSLNFLQLRLYSDTIQNCFDDYFKPRKFLSIGMDNNLGNLRTEVKFKLEEYPEYLNLYLDIFNAKIRKEISNVSGYKEVYVDGIRYIRVKKDSKDEVNKGYFISEYEEFRIKNFPKKSEELLNKYFKKLYECPRRYYVKEINGEERLFLNREDLDALSINKKIEIEESVSEKISKEIEDSLEVKKDFHNLEKERNATYELKSFISHEGPDFESGHFVAYIKVEGDWYKCSDSLVEKKEFSDIKKELELKKELESEKKLKHPLLLRFKKI
jgi:hypothetical protein